MSKVEPRWVRIDPRSRGQVISSRCGNPHHVVGLTPEEYSTHVRRFNTGLNMLVDPDCLTPMRGYYLLCGSKEDFILHELVASGKVDGDWRKAWAVVRKI
jgi:hypothetical protein